jgi:hypothetical protein
MGNVTCKLFNYPVTPNWAIYVISKSLAIIAIYRKKITNGKNSLLSPKNKE